MSKVSKVLDCLLHHDGPLEKLFPGVLDIQMFVLKI